MSTTTHNPHRPAPRFANPGRRARLSFLTRNKEGVLVRQWHVRDDGTVGSVNEPHRVVSMQVGKSLRGMVRP